MENTKWSISKIYKYLLKKYKFTFVNLMLAYIIAFVSLLFPLFFKLLVDIVFYEHDFKLFFLIIAGLVILLVCRIVADCVMDLSFNEMNMNFGVELTKLIYNKIFRLKPGFISRFTTGEFIERIDNEASQFWFMVLNLEIYLILPIIQIIASALFISLISYKVAILLAIGIPLALFITNKISKQLQEVQQDYTEHRATFVGWIYNLLSGIREIALFSAQLFIQKIVSKKDEELQNNNVRINYKQFFLRFANNAVYLVLLLAVYLVCVLDIQSNQMTLGSFVAITFYYDIVKGQASLLADFLMLYRMSLVSIRRVVDLLNAEEEEEEGTEFPETVQSIVFENVTFGYNADTPVLRNLNLRVDKGVRTVIVGRSGIGKSTLFNLLLRFYDVDEGRIIINGTDIREFSISSLRRGIGIIFQQPYLLADTIRFNIEQDGSQHTDEELYQVLHLVQMEKFIRSLPQGLDTPVGMANSQLSVGQMQRIVFARILSKKPAVFLLDEATASLDTESEDIIKDTINHIVKDHVVLSVSHRLSYINNSDQVVMIHDGAVVAQAPYNEMMETCREFQQLMQETD